MRSNVTKLLTHAALLCLLSVPSPALAQEAKTGPFGLNWTDSVENVKSLGVTLTSLDPEIGSSDFSATTLPKTLSDVELVKLEFGFNDKLWKVSAASKSFDNDPYGSSIKTRFRELEGLLAKKYGKPVHNEYFANYYDKPDNFVYGLQSGNGYYYSTFESDDEVKVELSIRAKTMNAAYYVLIYTFKPLEEAFETGKAASEGDAL